MSFFSAAQCDRLVHDFWSRGGTHCPVDGTPIFTQLHQHTANYLLVLACTCCGKKAQVTRFSDPGKHAFRKWTHQEKLELVAAYSDGISQVPPCPVCQANVRYDKVLQSTLLVAECPRCGNEHCAGVPWMENQPSQETSMDLTRQEA